MTTTQRMPITAAHCRAARGWLGWTQAELSSRSGAGLTAIKHFEASKRQSHRGTVTLLRHAFAAAGLECSPIGIFDRIQVAALRADAECPDKDG